MYCPCSHKHEHYMGLTHKVEQIPFYPSLKTYSNKHVKIKQSVQYETTVIGIPNKLNRCIPCTLFFSINLSVYYSELCLQWV